MINLLTATKKTAAFLKTITTYAGSVLFITFAYEFTESQN
jgi:hypothetical protein